MHNPQQGKIADTREKIEKLENKIRNHTAIVRDIKRIRADLEEYKLEYEFSKRFLPEKKEVPQLLRSISDKGAKAELNVLLFQPQPDVIKDFYAEIPFKMTLEGPYLRVTSFFDSIGRMERIVNIDDINIASPTMREGEMVLKVDCQGMTFRFLTPEELEAAEEAKKAEKKKKRKK